MRRNLLAAYGAIATHAVAEYCAWLSMIVFAFERGGAKEVALASLAHLIPAGLFAPLAARLSEKLSPAAAYRLAAAVQTLAFAAAALVSQAKVTADSPALGFYACSMTATLVITLTRPIHYAMLPGLLDEPKVLAMAVRRSRVFELIGTLVGPLVAGALLLSHGVRGAFAAAALCALFELGCALVLRVNATSADRLEIYEALSGGQGLVTQLKAYQGARSILALGALQWVLVGALDVLIVALSFRVTGSAKIAGLLVACLYLGRLAVALGIGRFLRYNVQMWCVAGAFLTALGLVLCSFSHSRFALGGALITGLGASVADMGTRTLIPRAIPVHLLGRVYALSESSVMLGSAVGSLLGPLLLSRFGLTPALVMIGLLLPAFTIARTRSIATLDDRGRLLHDPLEVASRSPLFEHATSSALSGVASAMERTLFPLGTTLMEQGTEGDNVYLIVGGDADVYVDDQLVATARAGQNVGEIALLRDVPRTATVRARTNVEAWSLAREPFLRAVTGSSIG